MSTDVNITRLDAFTYRERIAQEGALVLIPVGTIEQHGAHLPLGTDCFLPTLVAERVAAGLDAALVGPTVGLGYKSQQHSGGGNHILGTLGMDAQTLIATVHDLVREFARHGVRNLVFVNGHFENYQFLFEGVDLAVRELQLARREVPQVMMLSYWDFVSEEVIAQLYPEGFPGWAVEHGGVMETALMLEHFPDLVRMERVMAHPPADLPPYALLPVDPSLTPGSGCLSSAVGATAHHGALLTSSIVAGVTASIRERYR